MTRPRWLCAGRYLCWAHGALVLLVLAGTWPALLLQRDSDGRALWYPDLLGAPVALSAVTEAGDLEEGSSQGKGEFPIKENGEGGPS